MPSSHRPNKTVPKRPLSEAQKAGLAQGHGRPPGRQNKITTALKDMILQALDGAGGVDYLQTQAKENPACFLTLVGKVLPLQVTGADGEALGPIILRVEVVPKPRIANDYADRPALGTTTISVCQ